MKKKTEGYQPEQTEPRKEIIPPNAGSHVKVPKTASESNMEKLLERILEELIRIKLILTVGKEI